MYMEVKIEDSKKLTMTCILSQFVPQYVATREIHCAHIVCDIQYVFYLSLSLNMQQLEKFDTHILFVTFSTLCMPSTGEINQ